MIEDGSICYVDGKHGKNVLVVNTNQCNEKLDVGKACFIHFK